MKRLSEIGLVSAALFWGASGILTQVALKEMSPFMLIGYRFLIAGLLGMFVFKMNPFKISKAIYKHSLVLSLLLMVIYVSSTYGLQYTSASNAGFIIGSSVILVPIINGWLFKVKLSRNEYISSFICFIGLALVTLKSTTGLNKGDLYCFIDAVAYSLFIIYSSRLSKDVDIKVLSGLQYIFVTGMTFVYISIFEKVDIQVSLEGWLAIVLLGTLCTFLAFMIQIMAQRHTTAERASRILSLIPIFTVLFDYLYFGVILTIPAIIGGTMIIASTVLLDKKQPLKLKNS